ncbi:MAG TPA: bifunctional hydroxymethylpyrimidine kinase/phosphomethylpyrimidine kinase [Allosphingosinicella sp.]|nr:bifunctional hydroxymethylpyrimidine kinase/phosphomethylpyrimidine kinase [Allosphingosinicella sp.]
MTPPPRVLIIAGSDSGGGAGIQADIKTVTMLGGFAMTAITAITAQNTLGVHDVLPLPLEIVRAQFDAVVADLGVDAVKIGMLGTAGLVRAVGDCLRALPPGIPVILDPVMVATSGDALNEAGTGEALLGLAGPASLVTPNVPELKALTQTAVTDEESMASAAMELARRFGCPVLAKGGHLPGDEMIDLLVGPEGVARRWSAPRIASRNTHGTGCTLASAVATGLGRGQSMVEAIEQARGFVRTAILAAPGFGAGHGPMAHHAAASGEMNLNQVTLPARDYEVSVAFYRTLGLAQIVDSPGRYARFECPGGATLSIHVEEGTKAGDAIICLESSDLDAWVASLQAAGVAFETLPVDQRWGWREARLRDPAGNRLCLYRAGEYRRFPPWRLPAE